MLLVRNHLLKIGLLKSNKMKKYQKEIIGIYFFFISFFLLLSLLSYDIINSNNIMGPVGYYIADKLILYFGIISYSFPILLSVYAYHHFSNKDALSSTYIKVYIFVASAFAWLSLVAAFLSTINDIDLLKHYSGFLSLLIISLFTTKLGYIATFILLILYIVVANMIYFNISLNELYSYSKDLLIAAYSYINKYLSRLRVFSKKEEMEINNYEDTSSDPRVPDDSTSNDLADELELGGDSESDNKSVELDSYDVEISNNEDDDLSGIDIKEEIKEDLSSIDLDLERKKRYFAYNLPSSKLLSSPIEINENYSESELHQKSDELIYALSTFGVNGKVRRINQGPVITLFEVEPDEGVRVSKFINLSDDLSRVMKASKVRVIAPIPGTRFVGIEVPNESPAIVYMKSIINSDSYKNLKSKLSIALGKTTSGKAYSFELDKMPHLLVAGATGAGKSVCINAIIASILYKAKPDEVKFILIDPKKVELSSYNSLENHHLITSSSLDEHVITKTENATAVLESALVEMERRFEIFSEARVRNIGEYNEKLISNSDLEKIPYLVIVIDELADLMMTSGRAVEDPITRLAQKARAVGIHLIVATQRPSVDVITGLIKSNFPARIAFQVSSKIDSRTIIDQNGAETLLGNGDMLFLPPGSSSPIRLHGAFITLKEIELILSDISSQPTPDKVYLPNVREKSDGNEFSIDDRDDLLLDAAKLVIQHQQASVSLLQRKFRIGYSRAGRIIDELESLGIVSGYSGSKARDVLVDESYLDTIIK